MACSAFRRRVSTVALSVVCLSLAGSLAGCGGGAVDDSKKTPRVNATGKVEFDGKPIPAGTVAFMHQETGNVGTCTISDGTYTSDDGQGPNPGLNTVMITAKETADGSPLWAKPWTKQQVQVGDADFTENFSIKATEVKPYDPNAAATKGLDAGDTYDVGS